VTVSCTPTDHFVSSSLAYIPACEPARGERERIKKRKKGNERVEAR